MGRNLYVTQRGLQLLADRDRVDTSRLVEVTHLDPEGEAAIRERRHDSAVAETAAAFRGAGIPVVAGWRWMVEEQIVEQSLQHCLMLEDQHLQAIRSGNFLWWLVVSPTKTDPRQAFRRLQKDYPSIRQDVSKQFNDWSRMVDRAARASRPAPTLE